MVLKLMHASWIGGQNTDLANPKIPAVNPFNPFQAWPIFSLNQLPHVCNQLPIVLNTVVTPIIIQSAAFLIAVQMIFRTLEKPLATLPNSWNSLCLIVES